MTKFVKVMFGTTSGAKSDFEYKLNEINESNNWNPNADNPREFGGFNYATDDCIIRWLHRGDTIYDVEIPEDAEFVKLKGATTIYRTNKIKISNPQKVTDDMALDFYKKSNIPNKSYFKALGAVTIMGYEKTALAIIKDKINSENIDIVLEEWNDFINNGGDGNRIDSNKLVNKINTILMNIKNTRNEKVIVEVGFKLEQNQDFYEKILKNNNSINRFNCETHDIYWTNKSLDGMSENQMKNACVRLRMTRGFGGTDRKTINKLKNFIGIKGNWNYRFQNYNIFDASEKDKFEIKENELNNYINKLENNGFKKVFDTYKTDYQFSIGDMKSRIQLQNIKVIGLLLYYDNPDYYDYPFEKQRIMLIDELNSYGFDFKYSDLGLDKLRTLHYKKDMFSDNQNS